MAFAGEAKKICFLIKNLNILPKIQQRYSNDSQKYLKILGFPRVPQRVEPECSGPTKGLIGRPTKGLIGRPTKGLIGGPTKGLLGKPINLLI